MIKEYKIEPYPRRLWVTDETNLAELRKQFSFICEIDSTMIESSVAITIPVKNNDNLYGYLVIILDDCNDRQLVHESVHVVLNVYSDCDCSINEEMDQEPFAYLVESIFKKLKQ